MKKIISLALVIAFAFTGTAIAAKLPSYYPTERFQHTGIVDAVYAEEGRIVIDDTSYPMSSSAVVHSLSSNKDSFSRIRKGANVAFKMRGNAISEFWLLPMNYKEKRRR